MARAGEMLPALLSLLLLARPPALGRPPRLREPRADHVKEHQLGTLVTANNSSNKTSLLVNSAQSAWKKTCQNLHGGKQNNSTIGRNYKNFKTKSKAPRQKVGRYKHQQKLLSDILNVLMNQHKPRLIGNESMKAQVSRKWTGNGKLTETNMKLTKNPRKIFKLGKFEDTKTLSQHKMDSDLLNEFQIIEKKPTNKTRMKFQRELFDSLDTCIKYLGTKPSLVIAALSKTDLLPTVERALSRKNMNNLESILALTIIKNQMVLERKHYHIKTLKKEKNKHTNDRFLTSAKQKELAEMRSETWAQQKTNAIRRNQPKRLTDARKVLISTDKKSQHTELQKYGHFLKGFQESSSSLKSKPSGISTWERKSGKTSVRPNTKFLNFLNLVKQRAIVLQKGQPTNKEVEDAYITGSAQHRPNDSKYIWCKSFHEVRTKVMAQVKEKKAKAIAAISVEANQKSFTQVMIPHKRKDTVQKMWLVYKTKSTIHERKQNEPFKIKASLKQKWKGNADDGHIPEKERTAFGVERMAYSSRNDCTEFAKLNFVLPTTDFVENVKHTLFTPLMAQTMFPNQVEKIKKHSILPLWNIKQKKISYAQEDLKVRDKKAAVSHRQVENTGSKHKNLKRGENSSTSLIHPPKPSSPSALNKGRRKRSANGESVKVPVEFLSHLSSVLVAGATIVGIVIFALGLAVFCLFYKRRKICQFLGSIAEDEELPNGFVSTDAQYYKPVSLSQYFHAGKLQLLMFVLLVNLVPLQKQSCVTAQIQKAARICQTAV
ncbi:uncharacterized protein LOC102570877 isoform X2 [Alligator mississippiensis]|uniref:uncharacterized protein LOC102570877 isoform X2 n=1 Tax=Alligator mississippiensis TaxID=8496 RepID=UPI0028778C13|nr:uncharacterized protein LOC102570877 isoform X2 [Alligator mississippiensis]